MIAVALLFVGAVLLVNGLVFLDAVPARAAVPINVLTGTILMVTVLYLVLPADVTTADGLFDAVAAAGFTVFGFTYLTVAGNTLLEVTGDGLGWYCGWATVIAAFLTVVYFTGIDDARLAWLWLSWSVLFLSFFLSLTTVAASWITRPTGLLTVMQSVTTATVPAALMLTDAWADTSIAAIGAVQLLVLVVFVISAVLAWRRAAEQNRSGNVSVTQS